MRVRAAACVLFAAAAARMAACSAPESPPLERYELGGDFELIDHRGEPFALHHRRGRPLLLFFGFTSCPDACPTMMSKLGQVMDQLPLPGVEVLFVSVDPERDTPSALAEYAAGYPYTVTGLTGTRERIAAVARMYGAGFEPGGNSSGGVDHSTRTYLIDGEGQVRYLFSHDSSVGDMATVIRRLL